MVLRRKRDNKTSEEFVKNGIKFHFIGDKDYTRQEIINIFSKTRLANATIINRLIDELINEGFLEEN